MRRLARDGVGRRPRVRSSDEPTMMRWLAAGGRYALTLVARSILGLLCLVLVTSAADAKTYELRAPQRKLVIELGPHDPPVDVVLRNWYCSYFDDQEATRLLDPRERARWLIEGETRRRMAPGHQADPDMAYILAKRVNWGYQVGQNIRGFAQGELKKDFVMRGLDAPPGKSRIYKKRNCFTKDGVERFVKWTANHVTAYMESIIKKVTSPPYGYTRAEVFEKLGWEPPPPRFNVPRPKLHTLIIEVRRRAPGATVPRAPVMEVPAPQTPTEGRKGPLVPRMEKMEPPAPSWKN